MSVLERSSILVTGGTGSFGKAFIRYALDNLDPTRIVIFSRDELKQYEARQLFNDDPRLRWFIGDIRDQHRLTRAMHGVDYVVHAAALKQVDTAEYNPFEFVRAVYAELYDADPAFGQDQILGLLARRPDLNHTN